MNTKSSNDASTAIVLAPALFVALWATGFIGARYSMPHADPMTFLGLRFAIAAALLFPIALIARTKWPRGWRAYAHLAFTGILLHGCYLGAVFAAISMGMEAGISALIVSLQPIVTAVLAFAFLKERLTLIQVFGLIIGLAGAVLVVTRKMDDGVGPLITLVLCFFSLITISVATVYQKRFCSGFNIISSSFVQFVAAAIFCLGFALTFEEMRLEWNAESIFAMAWLVVVLSIGAISLLHWLIQRGAATKVASLFYLVPAVTALYAFFLFDERFGPVGLLGMAVTILGVAMVNWKQSAK
ncbi:DMT family transporter [Alphaproteobacteria bacterium]|nr:DMT family transporter [Alphaproteobacteria bacterium]